MNAGAVPFTPAEELAPAAFRFPAAAPVGEQKRVFFIRIKEIVAAGKDSSMTAVEESPVLPGAARPLV